MNGASLSTTNPEYGLTPSQVQASQREYGRNMLELHRNSWWGILWRQLNSPLLLILLVTTLVSYGYGDRLNAAIIFTIMSVSVGLGFLNELSSERTVTDLLKRVSLSCLVIRGGVKQEIPASEVVRGDIVLLNQGSVVAADLRLVESEGLTIDESSLTGESLPVAKRLSENKELQAFMGTVVMSGRGRGVVQEIGLHTEFGRLSHRATGEQIQTTFQRGLSQLSTLMTRVIAGMAILICLLNVGLDKPPLEAVLFALAVAIGLTPALLPVIVTVCMSRGAHRMAKKGIVVKRLVSIEDLGNLDILCTDKTGTLTEGKISLVTHVSMTGREEPYVLEMALNCNTATHHHRVMGNPMDVAIWEFAQAHHFKLTQGYKKIAEEEFNFDYRGMYAVVERGAERLYLFKGAADSVLDRCLTYRDATGQLVPIAGSRRKFREQFQELNKEGLRLILVAQKAVKEKEQYSFEDAQDLELLGYLTFLDVPKPSARRALNTLATLGVGVKIVTGDNELVTRKICESIGLSVEKVLTGPAIERMTARELQREAMHTTVFARVSPEQKEQIITALRKAGKTVGYLGDGINDAGALHAADVSISVNTAVDVAKDVASVVLLKKGLDVLAEGVQEGRRIFANTIKYILMGTSSNFGNMFSVAGASLFLPFLPMTPSQILLNNLLYDTSQLGIPSDEVDLESLQRPHHWDIRYIYRYMLYFGPISSIFDYLSFAVLWFGFHAEVSQFQTGWFLESIATQILVVFIIRTGRIFYKSRSGKLLLMLCGLVLGIAFVLPFTPLAPYLNLSPLPLGFFLILILLVIAYLAIVEGVKRRFLAELAV